MTNHDNYVIHELISAKTIAARVETLGAEIAKEFANSEQLVLVGLLRGSFIFMADLAREINLPVTVDFIEASSYGDATSSSGEVKISKDLRDGIENKDVLIVEDIIDTGNTLKHVYNLLKARSPRKMKICTLLDKPEKRKVDMQADYVGFDIPDEFVVGYGIDYAERNRNLNYIGYIEFTDT